MRYASLQCRHGQVPLSQQVLWTQLIARKLQDNYRRVPHQRFFGSGRVWFNIKMVFQYIFSKTIKNNNVSFFQLRVDVINQLLKKLTKLVEILQELESFRYIQSLPMIYVNVSLITLFKTFSFRKDHWCFLSYYLVEGIYTRFFGWVF